MCGLLGLLAARSNAEDFVDALGSSLHCMRHRGPDDDGTWNDEHVVFGFNRLSIIDIENSHQPLQWDPSSPTGTRYALTFNGEIYNYRELREELTGLGYSFNTQGDGETIVVGYHHWGPSVVEHLRGMFAFAVWDSQEQTLFVARDQFGIKPLYMATTPEGTFFGSEKKCLLSLAEQFPEESNAGGIAQFAGIDLGLNREAVEHYVDLQYVPEPESLHTGIGRLESGSYAIIRPGQAPEISRWFHPTFPAVQAPLYAPASSLAEGVSGAVRSARSSASAALASASRLVAKATGSSAPTNLVKDATNEGTAAPRPYSAEAERLIDHITRVLEESVEKHMRADVTVGSFLSGGIDSTAIAALAKRHNDKLLTFTTGFERDGYSEADVAAESAAALGVEHVVKLVSPEEFADAIPKIMWYLDDPVADPALVPLYFVAQEARKHVKVVLSGEGADELFGGYNIYREPLSLNAFNYLPAGAHRLLHQAASALPDGVPGKSFLQRGTTPLEDRYYGNARSFNYVQMAQVIPWARPEWAHAAVTAPIYERSQGWDPVARMQHLDLFTWLRGDILVKADKMTMANSLELRVPFLDKEVFAVARTVPTNLKLAEGTSKWALRKALERIVPEHVLKRRKLGFPVPIRYWLAGDELHGWALDIIRSSGAGDVVDLGVVERMLAEHRTAMTTGSGPDHSRRLWTILAFLVWYGIFIDSSITPDIPQPEYPVEL